MRIMGGTGRSGRRVVHYTRVSTEEQKNGYSIDDQLHTLRSYSEREGDEVIEEIRLDEGYSGADPDRPGLLRILELAEAGAMDVVRATKRDRLFRSRLYRLLMDRDLQDYGVKLEALNDTGHRIGDGVQDDFAEWEREEITRRTMSGKLEKARQGKLVAGRLPNYGFAFNETRDAYVVDEPKMRVVRRIFRELAHGKSIHSMRTALNSEGVPPPSGRWWARTFIRDAVFDDVYKPHTPEEISELVLEGRLSAEVASKLKLEEGRSYGIWWYNRRSLTRGAGGRQRVREKPRSEWIAVPVVGAGVPREEVEAARLRLSKNEKKSSNGGRDWPLSGGIMRCASCGRAMMSVTTRKQTGKVYYSYVCRTRRQTGPDRCAFRGTLPAPKTEAAVWGAISRMLRDPEKLAKGIKAQARLAGEGSSRQGGATGTERRARALAAEIAEMEERRERYQDLTADGLMTKDELRSRLAAMDSRRKEAERELAQARSAAERSASAMRKAESLVESMSKVSEALEGLLPEQHREIYERLGLSVAVGLDKSLELTGGIVDFGKVAVCPDDVTSTR